MQAPRWGARSECDIALPLGNAIQLLRNVESWFEGATHLSASRPLKDSGGGYRTGPATVYCRPRPERPNGRARAGGFDMD